MLYIGVECDEHGTYCMYMSSVPGSSDSDLFDDNSVKAFDKQGGFRRDELVILGINTGRVPALIKSRPVVGVNAIELTPKQHKRRRGQTAAYHKKVQKRWNKRALKDPEFISRKPAVIHLSPPVLDSIRKVALARKLGALESSSRFDKSNVLMNMTRELGVKTLILSAERDWLDFDITKVSTSPTEVPQNESKV